MIKNISLSILFRLKTICKSRDSLINKDEKVINKDSNNSYFNQIEVLKIRDTILACIKLYRCYVHSCGETGNARNKRDRIMSDVK